MQKKMSPVLTIRTGLSLSTRDCSGGDMAGGSGEPPACTGNVLRREVDMFFKAHQLPVAGRLREGITGLAGKPDHGIVGAQRFAENASGTERGGAAFEIFQERLADAVALPA